MSTYKNERMLSALAQAAAEFVNRVSSGRSLITVTRVEYRDDGRTVNVFVSVMPDSEAKAAVEFLGRQKPEFSAFTKKRVETRALPPVEFMLDPEMGVDAKGIA